MKKLLIFCVCILSLTACEDMVSLNDAPKQAKSAIPEGLFANAQKNLAATMASTNVNLNIFRMLAQQWTETTYTDEAKYNLATRNIPQNFWNALYRDVLRDFRESKNIVTDIDPLFIDARVRTNQLAMIEIMEVYTNMVLVASFGDMPYAKALDSKNLQPAYDDAEVIYMDLITRLDKSLASLVANEDAGAGNFEPFDLIYHGQLGAWITFGNSLKLKMGMLIADSNPEQAKTIVEDAFANGVFAGNQDNASFAFLETPPNTNPVWVDLVQSGRKDFVAANTLVNAMKANNDPRIPAYFTLDKFGGYTGGNYGLSNSFSTYSKPGSTLKDPTFPHVLLDYSEIEFYLAEAVVRGYVVGSETAEQHYNEGIAASMESWSVNPTTVTAYLANATVAYTTAPGTPLQRIAHQKWIALYNRGWEAWTEWRRLDYPILVAPPGAYSAIPLRLTYPVQEQNLNGTNYTSASAKIGGDKVETKLFFDKN